MSPTFEMAPLTPNENLRPEDPKFKVYYDALDSAFNNPQIRNLALSGSLGSGKSSIIRSYDQARQLDKKQLKDGNQPNAENHPKDEKRFLYVSLIDFSRSVKDAKADQNDQRQLEYSLLNQILSYCTSDDLPEGSIAGIPGKTEFLDFRAKGLTLLSITAFILIFHEKFGALATMFGVAEPLRSNMHPLLYLCAAIVLCCCIYPILQRCLPYLRLSKLLFKSNIAEAEVNIGKERTTLDAYKFELAYILERIGDRHDRTVVFEDLERLDPDIAIDIMSKLRELNNLTNNHLQRQSQDKFQPIRFLYAISDTTMPAPYRTKFYDCIIPVVPVAHPLNSRGKFRGMLEELKVGAEWSTALCDALSDAFVDYRTLLSLKNEFLVYRAYCKTISNAESSYRRSTTSFDDAFLLAITAYKILLPEWFERTLSPQGDGILPDFSSAAEQEALERYLKQDDRKKAIAAVRNLFDRGLLDKASMRLIIGESILIEQWLTTVRYALDRDTFDENDEVRITNMIDALTEALKDIKPDPSQEPYAGFRKTMTERLGMLTEDGDEIQLLLLVESLSAVSRKDVPTDWEWGTPEIAKHYENCLDNRYKAQALPKPSRAQHLKSVHDRFAGNMEITLRYANSLINLSYMQKLPECADTVALLKELWVAYPKNPTIALAYAMGLVNLSRVQELPECADTIALLKELRDAYPDNQKIALEYAKGLFNLAFDQELAERKATIALLKELRDNYPENQEIALTYAMGLVNLSSKQELAECEVTVGLLKELREYYPENQEIALEYAKGLFNLSNAQDLAERKVTISLLEELRVAYPENQEIALRYAMGLFNLSNAQDLAERKVTIDLLKELREYYPENQEIAEIYDDALKLLP